MSIPAHAAQVKAPPAKQPELAAGRGFSAAVEGVFETGLWACRYAVLIAVVASLFVSFGMFYTATVDTIYHLKGIPGYANEAAGHGDAAGVSGSAPPLDDAEREQRQETRRSETIAHVVQAIDGYLLATVMLIFAFGLYELFISRIAAAEADARASRILQIHTLDDLKHRLGHVMLLILVVKFFERALRERFDSPVSLLMLAIGILIIAGALYLTHHGSSAQS